MSEMQAVAITGHSAKANLYGFQTVSLKTSKFHDSVMCCPRV